MIENFSNLLIDMEMGREIDAFEAAKKIAFNRLSEAELTRLSNIVSKGIDVHNRETATYAISRTENRSAALSILIDILGALQHHAKVRGQAAEGIGFICPSGKFKLRMSAEEILLKCLKDSSPIVRFWSCYAVGALKMESALPILQELQIQDHEICPGWWYISEEAEDAINTINNRECKDRIPVLER